MVEVTPVMQAGLPTDW